MRNVTVALIAGCLCFTAISVSSCGLSPEQLRERVRAAKEKLDEAKDNNKMTRVVCAKKQIQKGSVISSDDVELKEMPDSSIPMDALTVKQSAELKKAKRDINYGEAIGQKDVAPLVSER